MHACSVCKLYINVYICILYIIVYMCICMHVYTCMCVCMCVYIYLHVHVCMYVHAYYALINLIVLLIVQYMHEGPVHCHINLQQI